jgi:membrane protease YdiL (CAAX protease family)
VLWFVISLIYLVTFSVFWQLICSYWHISLLNRSSLLTTYTAMPFSQTSMVLIIGVIGPLSEEVLFRGLLFRRLDEMLTIALVRWIAPSIASPLALVGAVSISAGVFAALHPDMNSFPIYFVIGAVLALWVKYTRSIWPGWVIHMAFNSLFIIRLIIH